MHRVRTIFTATLLACLLGTGCDSDNGDSSSSGGGSGTTGGASTSGATGGGTGNPGCQTTGDTAGQCQAYVDCVEANCDPCLAPCADFFSCSAACPCGDGDCALECYNNRSPACVTCLDEQSTCIQMNCLDALDMCSAAPPDSPDLLRALAGG